MLCTVLWTLSHAFILTGFSDPFLFLPVGGRIIRKGDSSSNNTLCHCSIISSKWSRPNSELTQSSFHWGCLKPSTIIPGEPLLGNHGLKRSIINSTLSFFLRPYFEVLCLCFIVHLFRTAPSIQATYDCTVILIFNFMGLILINCYII